MRKRKKRSSTSGLRKPKGFVGDHVTTSGYISSSSETHSPLKNKGITFILQDKAISVIYI